MYLKPILSSELPLSIPNILAQRLCGIKLTLLIYLQINLPFALSPLRLQVLTPDVLANNGVIQGISRVLFPPPRFTKEEAIAQAAAYNASVAAGGIPAMPGPTGAAALGTGPAAAGALPAAVTAPGATGAPGALVPTTPAATEPGATGAAGVTDGTAATAPGVSPEPNATETAAAGESPAPVTEASPAPSADASPSPATETSPSPSPEPNSTASPEPAGTVGRRLLKRW
jgi:hypothetical protein